MLRERAGSESVSVELDEGATVREALEAVGREHGLGDLLARMPVAMAVNREYATTRASLHEGDELALIPPVSGGEEAPISGSQPARATSASWSWSATTSRSRPATSSCSACGRCRRARARAVGVHGDGAVPESRGRRAGRLPDRDARRDDGPGRAVARSGRVTASRRSS